jgi:hypothetical protein
MTLEPHISRWWDLANERRQRLILKKYKGGDLSKRQKAEFIMLQGIADVVMSYAAPIDFGPLKAITKKFERLAARVAKASLKSSEMGK